MAYELWEHRHRFSVWAAARAAQRGFSGATVDVLRDALGAAGIQEYVRANLEADIDAAQFARQHREWCITIVGYLQSRGVKDPTFGRAAKLVAVYLKSMVVLSAPESRLGHVAHPPIDRILLQNLARQRGLPRKQMHTPWTKLDEEQYLALIGCLRSYVHPEEPFWKLEEFWTVTDADDTD